MANGPETGLHFQHAPGLERRGGGVAEKSGERGISAGGAFCCLFPDY
jgi:hypothetical protein